MIARPESLLDSKHFALVILVAMSVNTYRLYASERGASSILQIRVSPTRNETPGWGSLRKTKPFA